MEGQLVGASLRASSAHASFSVALPSEWKLTAGSLNGASHVDTPSSGRQFCFSQPISWCATGRRSAGCWPSLQIKVGCPVPTNALMQAWTVRAFVRVPNTLRLSCTHRSTLSTRTGALT